MILETFFVVEEKHAIHVQNLRIKNNLQDLSGRLTDMSDISALFRAAGQHEGAAVEPREATRPFDMTMILILFLICSRAGRRR